MLRKRRLSETTSISAYMDLRFILPTSKGCDGVSSVAGCFFGKRLPSIHPTTFEFQLFLHVNAAFGVSRRLTTFWSKMGPIGLLNAKHAQILFRLAWLYSKRFFACKMVLNNFLVVKFIFCMYFLTRFENFCFEWKKRLNRFKKNASTLFIWPFFLVFLQ